MTRGLHNMPNSSIPASLLTTPLLTCHRTVRNLSREAAATERRRRAVHALERACCMCFRRIGNTVSRVARLNDASTPTTVTFHANSQHSLPFIYPEISRRQARVHLPIRPDLEVIFHPPPSIAVPLHYCRSLSPTYPP